jgi:muconolactone D-isomerase
VTEYFVTMDVELPADLAPQRRTELLEAEARRAVELAAAGTLVRLWRIPGRRANCGIWRAGDATALHAALASLPLWPWLQIDVRPLADHPNDPLADRTTEKP